MSQSPVDQNPSGAGASSETIGSASAPDVLHRLQEIFRESEADASTEDDASLGGESGAEGDAAPQSARGPMERIEAALSLAADYYEVENGYLSRIDTASGEHHVVATGRDERGVPAGTVSDLSDTYCRIVLANGGPLTIQNAPEEGWEDDPSYQKLGLSCYLGTKVVVDGELFGTVCFFGPDSKDRGPDQDRFVGGSGVLAALRQGIEQELKRRKDSRKLQEQEAALEQAGESVLMTEANQLDLPGPRITYVNSAFERLTGYSEEEVIGKTPRILQGPKTERAVLDRLREALEAGEEWGGETVNYRKDGTPYIVNWRVAPVRDRDGDIRRWVAVQRDVTEAREREQALEEARAEAEEAKAEAQEASRLKSVLLANVSHELRTPLTSIIGFAETIKEEASAEGEGMGEEAGARSSTERFAGMIEESGKQLKGTLTGLLQLSELEAGQADLEVEEIDLARVAGPLADDLSREDGPEVISEIGKAKVRASRKGLRIALANLLENARKYTEDGGTVWVRTYVSDLPEDLWQGDETALSEDEKPQATRRGEGVVEVEDTGIGMTEDEVDRLTEAFRQGSEGNRRNFDGIGLGLAVTQKLTEKMGGRMTVDSSKGEGSRFALRFPLPQRDD